MKISNLTECTTAGAVATVAQPFKAVQQRAPATKAKGSNLLKGIKTSKKFVNSISEGEGFSHDVDRMVGHVKSSEQKLGKSAKEAENIAWATANKRGMLDNKIDEGTDLNQAIKMYKQDLKAAFHNGESEQRVRQLQAKIKELEASVKKDVAEGRFVKGPGGVPLDRQGNIIPPKAPKVPTVRRDANGLSRADYDIVWRKIENVVGQIFPDGDPIDWLGPWLDRQGIKDYHGGEVLNKACRLNGYKDIYAYYDHFKTDDYGYEKPVREASTQPAGREEPVNPASTQHDAPEVEPESDPELRSAEQSANIHYASAAKRKKGIEKFLLRSVKHAKETDAAQNNEIRTIKRDMDAIRQMAKGPMAEGEITEDDVVLSADRRKPKAGLLSKPEPTTNPADTVKLDIPLLIRLLEFAKEDAVDDMALHDLAEKLVASGARGRTLTMKDYDNLVPEKQPEYNDATDSVVPESLLGGAAAAGIIANDDDEDFQVSFQRKMGE